MSQAVTNLSDVLWSTGPGGIIVLTALAAYWTARSKAGRRWTRKTSRRVLRWLRVTLWGRRLGIGTGLAGRLQKDRWDAMARARKLNGLKRGKVTRSPVGVSVRLGLGSPMTMSSLNSGLEQIETGLGLRSGSCRIKPAGRSDLADLHIVLRDPLAGGLEWVLPKGRVRLKDPVFLAMTPYGDKVTLDVRQRIGVFGTSGSGKSCVQRVIGAHVVMAEDAQLEMWDLKLGLESQVYEGKAHRVTSPWEAAARTEWLMDTEFPRRATVMKSRKATSWKESAADPALVVMIDEGNAIIREFTPPQLKRFFQVVEQGRAMGVYFIWATQFPKATNLPTELRSQLNVTVCLQLRNAEESRVVFKDDVKAGWSPHLLSPHWALVQSARHRTPDEARIVFLDDPVFPSVPLSGSVRPSGTETVRPVSLSKDCPSVPDDLSDAVVSGPDSGRTDGQDSGRTDKVSVRDEILSVLWESDGPMGQREIARTLDKDQAYVGRKLKEMSAAGAVSQNGDRKYVAEEAPAVV